MPYYRVAGQIPAKRHTQFRRPDGRLYHEELMGAEGFSSDSALLYHANIAVGDRGQPGVATAGRVHHPPTTRCGRAT